MCEQGFLQICGHAGTSTGTPGTTGGPFCTTRPSERGFGRGKQGVALWPGHLQYLAPQLPSVGEERMREVIERLCRPPTPHQAKLSDLFWCQGVFPYLLAAPTIHAVGLSLSFVIRAACFAYRV